jgi:hypothetical protein
MVARRMSLSPIGDAFGVTTVPVFNAPYVTVL